MDYWVDIFKNAALRISERTNSAIYSNIAFDAYVEGIIDGVTTFSIYRDGERLCGALQRPLKEVLNDIKTAEEKVRMNLS